MASLLELHELPPLPQFLQEHVSRKGSASGIMTSSTNGELRNGYVLENGSSFEDSPRNSWGSRYLSKSPPSLDLKLMDSFKQDQRLKFLFDKSPSSPQSPRYDSRLLTAFSKLKEEMNGLRQMDVSLLDQLLNIYDVMHECKTMDHTCDHLCGMTDSMCSMESSIHSLNPIDDLELGPASLELAPESLGRVQDCVEYTMGMSRSNTMEWTTI
ncbi:uncharacterized protein LOC141903345 isoform X1 [Tubulanus polymorphus]|uniref:uncharacterized protein LOC141903345 isoform X1 n=1 Tax=Tubulanus polymorphus TaxID=672921 RepID=UPI003DA41162